MMILFSLFLVVSFEMGRNVALAYGFRPYYNTRIRNSISGRSGGLAQSTVLYSTSIVDEEITVARLQNATASDFAINSLSSENNFLPPPPDPTGNPNDDMNRQINNVLPSKVLYFLRDYGILRSMAHTAVLFSLPELIEKYPSIVVDLFRLTGLDRGLLYKFLEGMKQESSIETSSLLQVETHTERIEYGSHRSQYVNIVYSKSGSTTPIPDNDNSEKTIFFVHGGAWGSGYPEVYQLVATPFLNKGYHSVAVIGYRTYPDTDCIGQMHDVAAAIKATQRHLSKDASNVVRDYTVVAHSSGCHVCALGFIRGIFPDIAKFVSLAGVFDIQQHYRFEVGRGVARFSPMATACSNSSYDKDSSKFQLQSRSTSYSSLLKCWKENSPQYNLKLDGSSIYFPSKCLLMHGALDTTCPYNYSQEFGAALKNCASAPSCVDVQILPSLEHAEMVFQLMFGGITQDIVLNWLDEK